MSKTIVIHHSADFDGLFCEAIARKFLPDAEFIGWDFGDPPLQIPNGPLYVMDLPLDAPFGFKYKEGDAHGPQHPPGLVWIDHHASSIRTHPTDIPGYRIDGVAACRLAWQWFKAWGRYLHQTTDSSRDPAWFQSHYPFPTKADFVDRKLEEPLAVRLAGEYDIWDKRDPDAELFQHGLKTRDLTACWPTLLGDDLEYGEAEVGALLLAGKSLQYARDNEYRDVITQQGFTVEFEGITFLCCNSHELDIRSQLFAAGIKPEHQALMGFTLTRPCNVRVSLYHAPGHEYLDLSLIAVKYGGGGHRGACGFRAEKLPFLP
jgi:hypothetical protein